MVELLIIMAIGALIWLVGMVAKIHTDSRDIDALRDDKKDQERRK